MINVVTGHSPLVLPITDQTASDNDILKSRMCGSW